MEVSDGDRVYANDEEINQRKMQIEWSMESVLYSVKVKNVYVSS